MSFPEAWLERHLLCARNTTRPEPIIMTLQSWLQTGHSPAHRLSDVRSANHIHIKIYRPEKAGAHFALQSSALSYRTHQVSESSQRMVGCSVKRRALHKPGVQSQLYDLIAV